ncbi:MAG: peptidoglycan-binding protein [Clostridia bacterium]|nr:peptidoglycan-binding protein [Clostridia bacterium]
MALMKKGCKGEDVRAVQEGLTALGIDCGPIDGKFGKKTKAGVEAFQRQNALKVDGIVGPITDGALEAKLKNLYPEPKTEHYSLADINICRPALRHLWQDLPVKYYPNAQKVLERMELVREKLLRTWPYAVLQVRNGYRPEAYNKQVGGARKSRHLYGQAVDLMCKTDVIQYVPNCYQIGVLCLALFNEDGGLGLGSNTNVHMDIREKKTRWYYTYKTMKAWEKNQQY